MTLFPETVGDMMNESILGRAQERDFIKIECHQIRDYTTNKQNQVDDYPYGGGRGAVMQADPLYQLLEAHLQDRPAARVHTIYMSPCGKTFCQADAKRLARDYDHLILVCGHYEGIDERFIEECVDEEISLGDFVLTGGEIRRHGRGRCRVPAGARGAVRHRSATRTRATGTACWSIPQYSRPEEWHGRKVPDILLSGHHANIAKWRRKMSLRRTRERRPDMYAKLDLSSKADQKLLAEIEAEDRAAQAEQK